MTSDLAAAILALKEMYESESAEPPDHGLRSGAEQDSPRPETESGGLEPGAGQAEAGAIRARADRAFRALASEHEMRLAAEAELERLRAEIERGREQLLQSVRQATAAEERAEQVEAKLAQLRGGKFRRWAVPSAIAVAIVLSGWALSLSPHLAGVSFVAGIFDHRGGTGEAIRPEAAPTTISAGEPGIGSRDPVALTRAGQTVTPAATANEAPVQPAAGSPARQDSGDTGAGRATALAKVEPTQEVPAAADDTKGSEPGSTTSQLPTFAVVPTNAPVSAGNAVANALATKVSIHFEQSSSPARTDAQKLAASLALSGFGTAQLRSTQRAIREPVVRYFYFEDAAAAGRIVAELQTQDAGWKVEDCTRYRHKPAAGSIEVWPARHR